MQHLVSTNTTGTDLFDAVRNSPEMQQRGYKILYAKPISDQGQSNPHNITHGVCFSRDFTFIHLRISADGKLFNMMEFGDNTKIAADVAALVQEIQNTP